MSLTWLNSIKALKVGALNQYIIVYRTGEINDTETGYRVLKGLDNQQIIFTYEEARECIERRFGHQKFILKAKSRQAEFYQEGELVKVFLKALYKKEKFNIVEAYTPSNLKVHWRHHCAILEREWDEKNHRLISSHYIRINENNWKEIVSKLNNNSKNLYFKFNISRNKTR